MIKWIQPIKIEKVAFADLSLKILILNCLQDLGCAETEAKTVVLGPDTRS